MIPILEKLSNNGDLVKLHKAGIISYKILMYRDIYLDFQIIMTTTKFGRTTAYHELAEKYKVSYVTICRAVKWGENGEC